MDVQIAIEGCDHSLTPAEARKTAQELLDLADTAEMADAPRIEVRLVKGLVTRDVVAALLTELYPQGTKKWAHNTTRLWNTMVALNYRSFRCGDQRTYSFTLICVTCSVPHTECAHGHGDEHIGVPVHEVFANQWAMRCKSPAVSTGYCLLASKVRVIAG